MREEMGGETDHVINKVKRLLFLLGYSSSSPSPSTVAGRQPLVSGAAAGGGGGGR